MQRTLRECFQLETSFQGGEDHCALHIRIVEWFTVSHSDSPAYYMEGVVQVCPSVGGVFTPWSFLHHSVTTLSQERMGPTGAHNTLALADPPAR